MRIEACQYKDIAAVCCRTETLQALFSAQYGGKMLSLTETATGRELLAQTPGAQYRKPQYDGVYISAECSGFDDMFPTIDADYCRNFPWEGARLPDHGEVWALPWQQEITDGALHLWTDSPRFGYRLDKWITAQDAGLRVSYRAENRSPWALDCLYAAHCMLAASEGAVLELPYPDGAPCTTIFSTSGRLGTYGTAVRWRKFQDFDLARTYPKAIRDGFKVYFDDPIPEGWCRYRYDAQSALRVSFDPAQLPYFGLWVNLGAFQEQYNVAIEPCTAPMDSPALARTHGKTGMLKAGAQARWHLEFHMENGG